MDDPFQEKEIASFKSDKNTSERTARRDLKKFLDLKLIEEMPGGGYRVNLRAFMV
jgi:uncharacterized lipoprotein YajG